MEVRTRLLWRALLALAAVLAVIAPQAHALDRFTLASKLGHESRWLGAASGAYVMNLTTGRELFARNPDLALIPASNEKLFTTATTIMLMGANARLTTVVRAAPGTTIDDTGVVHGDLYLVGGGDPSLDDRDLQSLAQQLVQDQGITAISGGIIGDESLFDVRRGGPRTLFRPDGSMGGLLGALTWGHGRADTAGPAHLAAQRLHALLKADGVRMSRRARVGRLKAPAATQPPQETLAAVSSPTIRKLIRITNQPSDNFYAEMLLKNLGARFGGGGTTEAGVTVMRTELAKLGVEPTVTDGSGLSRGDRATPRQIVKLLGEMRKQPTGRDWAASLAAPGKWGTLHGRMRWTAAAGRCRMKTGTLIGVSALSGYCRAAGGDVIAFSFLENNVCAVCAKRVEDRMVPTIARYSR